MTLLTTLNPMLQLRQYHQIPVLEVNHPKCSAKIALQGAHLFSWQPRNADQDLLWLSEIEPFQLGNAIRGGVPICYPWFGSLKSPSHGTARIQLWTLADYQITPEAVVLTFTFDEQNNGEVSAKITMILGERCQIRFQHLAQQPAQVALHSYFNIGDIEQIALYGLPSESFNSLTKQSQAVNSPRKIAENVDEIYAADKPLTEIVDAAWQRTITVEHRDASDIVVWNPWHKATSGMSEIGYKTMICVETARLRRWLEQGEQVEVTFGFRSNE